HSPLGRGGVMCVGNLGSQVKGSDHGEGTGRSADAGTGESSGCCRGPSEAGTPARTNPTCCWSAVTDGFSALMMITTTIFASAGTAQPFAAAVGARIQ